MSYERKPCSLVLAQNEKTFFERGEVWKLRGRKLSFPFRLMKYRFEEEVTFEMGLEVEWFGPVWEKTC